jgi:hypothetical protein
MFLVWQAFCLAKLAPIRYTACMGSRRGWGRRFGQSDSVLSLRPCCAAAQILLFSEV